MGPFQCHLRWWWSHFSTSDGRRTCRPGAPRAGTGSARQCRGGSPMAANTSHVQCEWRTYDSIQGWRCRFHALGRQGGRWLREFLWPHSHFSEDFWLREVLSVEELVFWCVWLWVPWVFQSLVSDPFYPASGDPGSCGTCWCLHALYFFITWYQPLMNLFYRNLLKCVTFKVHMYMLFCLYTCFRCLRSKKSIDHMHVYSCNHCNILSFLYLSTDGHVQRFVSYLCYFSLWKCPPNLTWLESHPMSLPPGESNHHTSTYLIHGNYFHHLRHFHRLKQAIALFPAHPSRTRGLWIMNLLLAD